MRLWKMKACFSVGICVFAVGFSTNAARSIPGSPRIGNAYLDWQLHDADLSSLARWDIVILDADQQTYGPERLRKLRALNPSIKLFAYVSAMEIASARFQESLEFPMGKLASRIQESWYLRDAEGHRLEFWPGSPLLNVTELGSPRASESWSEFLPGFLRDEILSTGLWDGIFLDNVQDHISSFARSPVDLGRDGRADDPEVADRAWRAGMEKLLVRVRAANPKTLLIGNGGVSFSHLLNGVFFESFPAQNWGVNLREVRRAVAENRPPSFTILNRNTQDEDRPSDYQRMRFGLASALVAGSAYSFDRGPSGHRVLWWYDEFEVSLGAPRREMRVSSKEVWTREYERGIVLVNGGATIARVSLPGTFEKFRGVQDPVVNDGTLVRSIHLAGQDGILLVRHASADDFRGAAFENGAFYRIYDLRGRQVKSGFFAQRDDFPGGDLVVAVRGDRDGAEEIVSTHRGQVSLRTKDQETIHFQPYERGFTGPLSFAIGNVNRDPAPELVLGRDGRAPPEVQIRSQTGKLLRRWLAYRPDFSGGVRVAIGDLDGDGTREIVTGAGPGGGPHIRVWKTDGSVWGGGWFAFDPTDRGGVSLAVGDVDGDGRDEVIVASGVGAKPRVRLFDGKGTLKKELALGDAPIPSGLRVAASDVNGDGKKEILVSGLPLY